MVSLFSDAVALFFLWLFFSAGLSKLTPQNLSYYQELFDEYGIHSARLSAIMVKTLGAVELLSALAIVFPTTRTFAATVIFALLLTYLVSMYLQLRQGKKDQDCGCAGPGAHIKISPATIWRNAILSFLAISCLFSPYSQINTQWFLSLVFAFFLILTYLSAEKAIANYQRIQLLRMN